MMFKRLPSGSNSYIFSSIVCHKTEQILKLHYPTHFAQDLSKHNWLAF